MPALYGLRPLTAVLCLLAGVAAAQQAAPVPRAPNLAPQVSAQPSASSPARLERYLSDTGHRIGMEALGGALGMVAGVAGPLALAAFTCHAEGDFGCDVPLLLGLPGGLFLPSFGVFLMGGSNEGAGGYWYSVVGAATGWLTAFVLWMAINPLTLESSVASALALGVLPVGGAVAGYELSSLRALSLEQASPSTLKVSLAPWLSSGGARGLVLSAAF